MKFSEGSFSTEDDEIKELLSTKNISNYNNKPLWRKYAESLTAKCESFINNDV